MKISFTELSRLVAVDRGLDADFWRLDPITIVVSKKTGVGVRGDTRTFEVAEPRDDVPSLMVHFDDTNKALSVEFY
jgi:hypothetical protein